MKNLTIGIDFDNTFTADTDLWTGFIAAAHAKGHRCVLVTGRDGTGEWGAEVRNRIGDLMPIVFAGLEWKRDAAKNAGFDVNIWIDDFPEYIAKQEDLKTTETKENL